MPWTCQSVYMYIENEQNFNTTPLWDIYYSSLLTKLWTFSQVYIKGLKIAMIWKYEIHVIYFYINTAVLLMRFLSNGIYVLLFISQLFLECPIGLLVSPSPLEMVVRRTGLLDWSTSPPIVSHTDSTPCSSSSLRLQPLPLPLCPGLLRSVANLLLISFIACLSQVFFLMFSVKNWYYENQASKLHLPTGIMIA